MESVLFAQAGVFVYMNVFNNKAVAIFFHRFCPSVSFIQRVLGK